MRKILSHFMGICTLAFAVTLSAQGTNLEQKIGFNPNVKVSTLPNGIKVYVLKNGFPENRVSMYLTVNAGAVLEDDDQNGLAHFCEHMAFNGTKTFPKQELVSFLESTGIRFGADLNAETNQDETVYILSVPTNDPRAFQKAVQVMRDWSAFVTYDNKDIEEERGVVLEEWRLRKGAQERIQQFHAPALYNNSKYAKRNVIGDTAVLKHCPPENLRRFYTQWYRPENMAVIIVGDIDPETAIATVTKHFAYSTSAAGGSVKSNRPQIVIPPHENTLVSIASDPELTAASVQVYHKRAADTMVTMGDYRKQIAAQLATAMVVARMQEIAQKPNSPYAGAAVYPAGIARETRASVVAAAAADKNVLKSLKAALTEVSRVQQHGFTDSELDRAKKQVMARMQDYYNERNKTESNQLAQELVRHELQKEQVPGIEQEFFIYEQLMPTISAKDAAEAFIKQHGTSNRVVTISVPEAGGYTKPTEAQVREVLAQVATEKTTPYVDAVPVKPLLANKPKAGSVVSKKTLPEAGAEQWVLSNGARVTVKATNFKDNEILFSAQSWGGKSLGPVADEITQRNAASVIDAGGLAEADVTELTKLLNGKNVAITPYINLMSEGFSGSMAPQDIDTFFELLYLSFTAPRKDGEAVASYKTKLKTSLENRGQSPDAVLFDSITAVLTKNHPRTKPLSYSDVDKIDLDKAFEFYKSRFANAGDFDFVFVGNIPANFEEYVATYIASLPSTKQKEKWNDAGIETAKGAINKTVYKGKEDRSFVVMNLSGDFKYTPKDRYDLISLCEVMTIRLREKLREEKGGVYFVQVQPTMEKVPHEEYGITIIFSCAPNRVEELYSVIDKEIDTLQQKEVDVTYINKVREIQMKEREVAKKTNEFWLQVMNASYQDEEPLSNITLRDELIQKLSPKQVLSSAKFYLKTKNVAKFALKPEKI